MDTLSMSILIGVVGAILVLFMLVFLLFAFFRGLERIYRWWQKRKESKTYYQALKRSLFDHLEKRP